jgi:hypothetical protein
MDRSPPALRHPRVLVPTLLCACVAAVGVMVSGSGVMRAEADGEARAASAAPPRPPTPRPPRSISIGWVGDTVLGSRHGIPPDGGRDLLRAMRPTLRGADVMIGNLEGVIGTRGMPKCPPGTPNCFVFQAPPVAARTLAWAGFDVMNLANNHAFDHGRVGLDDTVAHLRRAGVAHVGRPGQVTVVERRGVRVAVVGFAAYPWAARIEDLPGAARLVRRARLRADVVIVVMHAGGEGTGQTHTPHGTEVAFGEARGNTRAFAHAVVDAGAHAVFGSGPHVVRGVERRHGRPIFYSTGNFAGFHTFPTAGLLGLSAVAQVRVDDRGRVRGGRWTSVRLTPPGRPAVDPGRASAALAARLSREDFAYPGLEPDGDLRLPARRPTSR